jgi:hypothetical protein
MPLSPLAGIKRGWPDAYPSAPNAIVLPLSDARLNRMRDPPSKPVSSLRLIRQMSAR